MKELALIVCLLLISSAAGLPRQDSKLKKYVSPNGTYEFTYPEWLILRTDPEGYSGHCVTDYLSCVEYPENMFKGTDFASGWFQLNIAQDHDRKSTAIPITSETQCDAFNDYAEYKDPVPNTTLHGIRFATLLRAGVAAGTVSDILLYRTFHNGTCYELSLTTAIIDAYDEDDYQSGGVKHFGLADNNKVKAVLHGMLNSFRFLK